MSYDSRIRGGISFEPPLNYREIRKWEETAVPSSLPSRSRRKSLYQRECSIKLVRDSKVQTTDQGRVEVITAASIEPANGATYLQDDLTRFVELFGEGRCFDSGTFDVAGERNGDVWRLKVENGEVVRQDATLVWDFEALMAQRDRAFQLLRELRDGGKPVGVDSLLGQERKYSQVEEDW